MSDKLRAIIYIPQGEFTSVEQSNILRLAEAFMNGDIDVVMFPNEVRLEIVQGLGPVQGTAQDLRAAFDALVGAGWSPTHPLMKNMMLSALMKEIEREGGVKVVERTTSQVTYVMNEGSDERQ